MPVVIAVEIVAALLATWTVAVTVLRGWSPSLLRARRRGQLIGGVIDAVVVLALARAVAPPPGPWVWSWLLAAAGVGVGFAGAVRRWPTLDWGSSRIGPAVRAALSAVYLLLGAAVVVVTA